MVRYGAFRDFWGETMDYFIGAIIPVAFGFAPKGFALTSGQLLPINQNQALFSLLGTSFGGNGQTNFALPNLNGRTPIGFSTTNPAIPIGQSAGEERHTLTMQEMPLHTHTMAGTSASGPTPSPENAFPGVAGEPVYGGPTNLLQMNRKPLAPAGGGQSHNNMQPYLAVNFTISLTGIFPSRN